MTPHPADHSADAFNKKMEEEVDGATTSARKKSKVKKLKKWIHKFETSVDTSISEYYTSEVTAQVEDRDIAACAVALVVASSRKGVVCLCTNVAKILKQNAKLEKKLEDQMKDQAIVAEPQQLPVISQSDVAKPTQSMEFTSSINAQILHKPSSPLKQNYLGTKELITEKIKNVDVTNRNADGTLSTISSDKPKKEPFSIVVTTATVHNSSLTEQTQPAPSSAVKHEPELNPVKKCGLLRSGIGNLSLQTDAKSPQVPRKSFVKSKKKRILCDGLLESGQQLTTIDAGNLLDTVVGEKYTCVPEDNPSKPYDKENYYDNELENTNEYAPDWKLKYSEIYQHGEKMKGELHLLQEKITAMENAKRNVVESSVQTMEEMVAKPQFVSVAVNTTERQGYNSMDDHEYRKPWLHLLSRQYLTPVLAPSPLAGCKCSPCESAVREELSKSGDKDIELFQLVFKDKPILEVNATVMIPGNHVAQVAYIGHLDSTGMPSAVFVGVIIDKPEGNSDGCYCNKRYFNCFQNRGIFMPINQILFIINHAINAKEHSQKKKPLKKMRSHSHSGKSTFYSH